MHGRWGVLGYGHKKGVDKPTMTTSHLSDKFKLLSSAFVCLLQQIINKTIVLHLTVGFIVEYILISIVEILGSVFLPLLC